MRKRILCSMLLAINILMCMAQTVQKHTVQRGETIESIAQKYGVTVSAMKEANPNIGDYFYVGMVLNVPEKKSTTENVGAPLSDTTQPTATTVPPVTSQTVATQPETSFSVPVSSTPSSASNRKGTWEVTGRFGWNALDYEEGMDLKKFGMGMMFGANYFFSEMAYMKLCAGYAYATGRKGNIAKEGQTSAEMHSIRIPISVNFLIPMGEHKGFSIGAGPYFDYVVSGKSEFKQGKTKIKTKFSDFDDANALIFGIHLQATLMFSELFGIYGEYGFGLKERYKKNKENYWSVGIAYGF